MGCSAQQHRVAIGLYHGRICSPTWSPCTGAYRVESSRGHDPSSSGGRGYWWNIQLLVAVTFIAVHLTAVQVLSPLTEEGQSFISSIYSETLGNTLSTGDCDYHVPVRTSGQIRMLLILSWGCGDEPWS